MPQIHSVAQSLEIFRRASKENQLVESIGVLSILAANHEERQVLVHSDGVTTITDHLTKLCVEQSITIPKWEYSTVLGLRWDYLPR